VLASACAGILSLAPVSRAAVVINELVYDDGSTDDREFVELYNNDLVNSVPIGGWVLGGFDGTTTNTSVTITAGTIIAPGGYYVIGQTGVLNVNQVTATFLENDGETVELKNGATLIDSVAYETNKGPSGSTGYGSANVAEIGPGFFGNHQVNDVAAAANTGTLSTVARFIDGRDTNNNGRDFGLRASTPGTTNNPAGLMTSYAPADVSAAAVGSTLSGFASGFVHPRVIDPTVVDANNPNAISAAPGTGKAIVAWDSSGGGNGNASVATFTPAAGKSIELRAYFDTNNLPLSTNASAVAFRGSEFTFYGIGTADALGNATNLSGQTNFGPRALPAADTDAGVAGIFWIYEKVGETSAGAGDVSEKLYLVDANDGGDASTGGNTPLDWTILATIDLSSTASGWHDLSIAIDAAGNGVASYDGATTNFTTSTDLVGAFAVGYRENTQAGAVGVPSYVRPATFTIVPEPASLSLLGAGALALARRRRKN
jgi:hypothetical protein